MRQLWGGMQEHQLVHIDFDEISRLWRLESAGHIVGPSLFKLFRDHITGHLNNFVCPYQTAHYIYALVKAGEIELADINRYGGSDGEMGLNAALTHLNCIGIHFYEN